MWSPFFIAIVFTILVYIFYRLEKNNTKWNRKATLLQTIGVVWALVFAVYSIDSANDGTNSTINEINRLFKTSKELSNQFEKLSSNLSSMPNKLDGFSQKLVKLDSIIDKQQINISSNLKILNNSISDFNSSLLIYRNSIDDYSSQLSKIVTATDLQLVIWKEQQAIVKKEYLRRPVLSVEPAKCIKNDSTFTVEGIIVANSGDIEANLLAVVFVIDSKDIIDVNIKTAIISKEKNKNIYQINFNALYPNQVSQHDRLTLSDFKITMRIDKEMKKEFGLLNQIYYQIRYQSQYSSEPFNGYLECK